MSELPTIGAPAPDFAADSNAGPVALADFKGRKNVVLYFFPRANTPG